MQGVDSRRPSFPFRAASWVVAGLCAVTLTHCSFFSSRDGAYTGYYLPLTVHLRSDPTIAVAQLTYQDACGQAQSFPIAAPLQELLKRKTGRVFEKVVTGETASLSEAHGSVDTALGLSQVDLAIPRKVNRRYPATVTLGLDFAYRALDGAVLYSKKIQSVGRGEVEVTDISCEVTGLEAIAYEAMDLVTDGMALQIGTSSKIQEAAHARKADGSQAVSLPSLAAAPVSTSVDQPSTVIFRAIVRHENHDQVFHSGEAIAIEVEVKNEGPGTAQAVELLVAATPILTQQIPGVVSIGDLKPGEVKHMTLDGKVGTINAAAQEELTLILRAKSPLVRLPSAKKFLVVMKPASTVETATPVDVDRLPKRAGLLKQPKAIGIVVGVGQFRESGIPSVKYAVRDASSEGVSIGANMLCDGR